MPTIDLGPCECCGEYPDSTCYYDGDESFQCVPDGEDPPEGWEAVGNECPRGCCCFWFQPFACAGSSQNAPCDVTPPESFVMQFRTQGTFVSTGYYLCGPSAAAYMNAMPELPAVTFEFSHVQSGEAHYTGVATSGNGWTLVSPLPTARVSLCSAKITIEMLIWERNAGALQLKIWGGPYIFNPPPPDSIPARLTIASTTNSTYPNVISVCDAVPAYSAPTSAAMSGRAEIAIADVPCTDVGPYTTTYPVTCTPTYDAPSLTFTVTAPNSPPVCFPEVDVDCGVCCESDGGCTAGVDGGLQSQSDCEDAGGTWLWNGDCDDCDLLENPLP